MCALAVTTNYAVPVRAACTNANVLQSDTKLARAHLREYGAAVHKSQRMQDAEDRVRVAQEQQRSANLQVARLRSELEQGQATAKRDARGGC